MDTSPSMDRYLANRRIVASDKVAAVNTTPRILFSVLLLSVAVNTGCAKHYFQTVLLDRPVNVSSEWVTLRFPQAEKARADWIQDLLASVSSSYQLSTDPFGMRMSDGRTIWPEVEIEDSRGQWLPLRGKGFLGNEAMFYDQALWGNGQQYVAVRLRSPAPITISRLVWESYDPREVKR